MIVTCPQCAKRYLVDDRELSQRRRALRCGSCSHSWFYETEKVALTPLPSVLLAQEDDAHPFSGIPEKRVRRPLSWGWALYLSVWIGLCGSVVLFRDDAVRYWPVLRPMYELVGLPMRQAETLQLTNLHMWPIKGEPYVLLRGEITNAGSEPRSMPPFLIQFEDAPSAPQKKQGTWYHFYQRWFGSSTEWVYQLSHHKLMPHEQLNFEIMLPCEPGMIKPDMTGMVSF